MLEGTAAKTRDGTTRGTPTVGQQRGPLSAAETAHETGVTQVLEAGQREARAPAVQSVTLPHDPRLVWTGAAPVSALP